MPPRRYQLLGQISQPPVVAVDRAVRRQTHGAREHPRNVCIQQGRAAPQAKDVHGGRRVGSKTWKFLQGCQRVRQVTAVPFNHDPGQFLQPEASDVITQRVRKRLDFRQRRRVQVVNARPAGHKFLEDRRYPRRLGLLEQDLGYGNLVGRRDRAPGQFATCPSVPPHDPVLKVPAKRRVDVHRMLLGVVPRHAVPVQTDA